MSPITPPSGALSIAGILTESRTHLKRLTPTQAQAKLLAQRTTKTTPDSEMPPVILVDIRPAAQRAEKGEIKGAFVIERNVLEWRFDPQSEARLDIADRYDLEVIVFCQEGYTSSLAARELQRLGLRSATDVIGGFKAWKDEGLPLSIEREGRVSK